MVVDLGSRYQFVREIGSGGSARTLLVRDLYLEREVALKLFHDLPVSAEDLAQAQREFKLLCEVEHPGIAKAHDFGYLQGHPFFTSDYVQGKPLSTRAGGLDAGGLLRVAAELAEALAFLHHHGILHLDVKPSNVIVGESAVHPRAVLVDFGLCRRGVSVSPSARIRGSLSYMAPEYFQGDSLGPWTDVYALGVTLYRVATGTFPRSGAGGLLRGEGESAAWSPAPPPLSALLPGCPEDVDRIVHRCLALSPSSRFRSAEEIVASLQHLEGGYGVVRAGSAAVAELVGRQAQLSEADAFLDAVRDPVGGQKAMLVTAAPGMGQSHFLRAVKVRAQTRGIRFYLETGYAGRPREPGSLLRALSSHLGRVAARRWSDFLAQVRKPRRAKQSDVTDGERRLRRAGEVALAARQLQDPVILAVDGLQFWDEVSIQLITDLIRYVGEKADAKRSLIGVIVAYREEGTNASLLGELTDYLIQPGKAHVVTVGPLDLQGTLALLSGPTGQDSAHQRGLAVYHETGGVPRRILGRALRNALPPRGVREDCPSSSTRSLDAASRRVLLTLALLDRPASEAEIAGSLGDRPTGIRQALTELEARGLAARGEAEGAEAPEWIASVEVTGTGSGFGLGERRRAHARIARHLLRTNAADSARRLVEAVEHLYRAGQRSRVIEQGIRAARLLQGRLEHRAALRMYRRVLESLPPRRRSLRLDVSLEIADLYARIGESGVDEGIQILREQLAQSRGLGRSAHERVLLRLATLHSRRGDFRMAERLFSEGLARATPAAGWTGMKKEQGITRLELLLFTNEHAAMKAIIGQYAEALELCERGFRLAGRSRNPDVREVVLNLHATRANVSLRTFDFEAAIVDLETAVGIAEAIGSPGNQATVLNNLGVVYSQCDRYADAIRAFTEAEQACLRLDEGPSLSSIYGNLAVLHAKTGDFDAMERALEKGERLVPAVIGRRQEFFLRHARGVGLLGQGRFAEARRHLESAIQEGRALGDSHVVAFDEVYRAEALIHEGRYNEALRALDRLCDAGPERTRRMAIARAAFLYALLGQAGEVERRASRYGAHDSERAIPFLDAWDKLYLGWASSCTGSADRADSLLREAEEFFAAKGLVPAGSLASWARAESRCLAGDRPRALALLKGLVKRGPSRSSGAGFSRLIDALAPLLEARIALDPTNEHPDAAGCADLLARSGAAMVGNPLPEWSARLDALQAHLREDSSRALVAIGKRRTGLAAGLDSALRRSHARSRHWRAWTGSLQVLTPDRRRRSRGVETPGEEGSTSTRTLALVSSRSRLVARSSGMRKLVSVLDRVRKLEVPILIRGETGSGKELVARIVHDESRRADGPFRVVDCATIPSGLLESELFGAKAGAFTGIDRDRDGILALAGGGTVFVDEIAGADLEVQAKLLRVIDTGRSRPLGAESERELNVRFLFSTARDLEAEVEAGRLRGDLYHRIRVVTLEVPPLRERPEDLDALVEVLKDEAGLRSLELSSAALDSLRRREWPGNARELRNLLVRLSVESARIVTPESIEGITSEPATALLFPRNLLAQSALPELRDRLERDYIAYHFRRLGSDTSALARFLGLSRRQLYRRCGKLGLRLRSLR